MPPKKKRPTQPSVAYPLTKMSTRSDTRSKSNTSKTTVEVTLVTKATVKQVKAPSKAKKIEPKKESTEDNIALTKTSDKVNNTEVEEMLYKLESDENIQTTPPIEQDPLKIDNEDNTEKGASGITEQLQNLNVDETAVTTIPDKDIVVEKIVENKVTLGEQIIEIDNCDDFSVEYITEEIVPQTDDNDVILLDASETEISDKLGNSNTAPMDICENDTVDEISQEQQETEVMNVCETIVKKESDNVSIEEALCEPLDSINESETLLKEQTESQNVKEEEEDEKTQDLNKSVNFTDDEFNKQEEDRTLLDTKYCQVVKTLSDDKEENQDSNMQHENMEKEESNDEQAHEDESMIDDKDIIKEPEMTNEIEQSSEKTTVPISTEKCEQKTQTSKSKRKPVRKETKKQPVKKQVKPKAPKKEGSTTSKSESKTEEVRRSSRIKSISVSKQRSKGHGLVKSSKILETETTESSNNSTPEIEKGESVSASSNSEPADNKPVKVKSRWRKSSEMEMNVLTPATVVMETCGDSEKISEANDALEAKLKQKNDQQEVAARLKQFVHLKENLYLTDRMACKEAKKMTCDCFLTTEETDRGELGCGDDCLNRLLMIECGNLCPVGERCTNKKFQKAQFAPVEVFKTDKKGLGLRAAANIPYGEFILEYVGEVLDPDEFDSRADDYSNDKNRHYYFMSLRADAIIDATLKGNISRFINHSCDPNAETQKWTVNGELRIGFFSTRTILAGEEITFDYRFQRYGKEAQKCFCEAPNCRGWLGEEPDDDEDDEEDEEDEEEQSEEKIGEPVKEIEHAVPKTVEKMKTVVETKEETPVRPSPSPKKKRSPRKKPRKEIFEDLDQLVEEIEMLVTTGLKNQPHTLKLSRLMVRAKEPSQRAKLLRVLRRGELPCRRLFLDYHGLRLIHGYMTDAQDLIKNDKKFESLRLELLQTLATLPIPNKTMLQDSKVLPTVEKWATTKGTEIDSDSSSPQTDQDASQTPTDEEMKKSKPIENPEKNVEDDLKMEDEIRKSVGMDYQGDVLNTSFSSTHGQDLADEISNEFAEDVEAKTIKPIEIKSEEPNYEEEIGALAQKLLEEWSNLKEVFKIPKKERIEQMKEHEREADRGYIAGLGLEQDSDKKNESRYRILKRYRSLDKNDLTTMRKNFKPDDRNLNNFPKFGKYERRKMFALQVEQREEERRRKQREMWRQHEQHCILLGTDPRLTAPFDPNRGYQCIWNPQIGQWQNYPIQNPNMIFNTQNPPVMSAMNVQSNPNYPFLQPNLRGPIVTANPINPLPSLPYQEDIKKEEVKFLGPIPPPAKLPLKWKCAKDGYGRPYYYHIKIRKSQWEPPPLTEPPEEPDDSSETTSSSDTSSISSDTSSESSDSDDELDDSRLLMQVKKQMERHAKASLSKTVKQIVSTEDIENSLVEETEDMVEKIKTEEEDNESDEPNSVEARLKDIFKDEKLQPSTSSGSKKRRTGLVSEIIISPRTEEDRLQFREDLKRYKMNKEKLKKEKEMILQQTKKHTKDKRIIKLKMKEMNESNTETAKKIKESFRSTMATVVVSVLNGYRKPDCKEGRINNTEDFKHLARKLTHFVMLKEMKHIEKIEELVCTENVKGKAREYIRKYMSKFGENYQKRNDEPDY